MVAWRASTCSSTGGSSFWYADTCVSSVATLRMRENLLSRSGRLSGDDLSSIMLMGANDAGDACVTCDAGDQATHATQASSDIKESEQRTRPERGGRRRRDVR